MPQFLERDRNVKSDRQFIASRRQAEERLPASAKCRDRNTLRKRRCRTSKKHLIGFRRVSLRGVQGMRLDLVRMGGRQGQQQLEGAFDVHPIFPRWGSPVCRGSRQVRTLWCRNIKLSTLGNFPGHTSTLNTPAPRKETNPRRRRWTLEHARASGSLRRNRVKQVAVPLRQRYSVASYQVTATDAGDAAEICRPRYERV